MSRHSQFCDECENPSEISNISEASANSCEMQQVLYRIHMRTDLLRDFLEKIGADKYIREIDRLDDLVYVLADCACFITMSQLIHDPMVQQVVSDGLKGKPPEFVEYFRKLMECGEIPPVLPPDPDSECLDLH